MTRPTPPASLCGVDGLTAPDQFVPAPDFADWLRKTFIADGAPLVNQDHAHLRYAEVGVLWTNAPNSRNGRSIVGQAELMPPGGSMGKWAKARVQQQIREWFGSMPDFVMTIHADYAINCDDASFCALVEHELYHMGQEHDEFGAPKFSKQGRPKYAMRGHDVEEFVGVVRRYGAEATNAAPIIEAAKNAPEVGRATISGACGTCLQRVA